LIRLKQRIISQPDETFTSPLSVRETFKKIMSSDCSIFTRTILPALRGTAVFNSATNCCTMPEITCVGTRITEIKIHDSDLNGIIPDLISELSTLQVLHLYRNKITGTIPSSLGFLQALKDLSIGGNQITGNIPPELGNSANL
jgi:Leucine-rich repeat (LRR) protein